MNAFNPPWEDEVIASMTFRRPTIHIMWEIHRGNGYNYIVLHDSQRPTLQIHSVTTHVICSTATIVSRYSLVIISNENSEIKTFNLNTLNALQFVTIRHVNLVVNIKTNTWVSFMQCISSFFGSERHYDTYGTSHFEILNFEKKNFSIFYST